MLDYHYKRLMQAGARQAPIRSLSTTPNDRLRRSTGATILACATIAAALFSAGPAVFDVIDYFRYSGAPGVMFVSRWALLVLWLCVLQSAYGMFLILWPERAAIWSVTISLLAHAAIYALTLGVIVISGASGALLTSAGLEPSANFTASKAALWCICMVSVWTLLAFFAGRHALAWRRAEMLARHTPRHST